LPVGGGEIPGGTPGSTPDRIPERRTTSRSCWTGWRRRREYCRVAARCRRPNAVRRWKCGTRVKRRKFFPVVKPRHSTLPAGSETLFWSRSGRISALGRPVSDVALKHPRHKIVACVSCKLRRPRRTRQILPLLGERRGHQKTARAQRQHNAADREWALQIPRTTPAPATTRTVGAGSSHTRCRDQCGGVLKRQIGAPGGRGRRPAHRAEQPESFNRQPY